MREKIIVIAHQLQYKKFTGDKKATYHITPTKSGKSRMIPMSDRVYTIEFTPFLHQINTKI